MPADMLRVAGPGVAELRPALQLPDFLFGKFEVTNRSSSCLSTPVAPPPRVLDEPVQEGRRTLSWDEAVAQFRTRPGASRALDMGTRYYATRQADFPVRGVSWYEAAAYAAFAGRSLPTVHHWRRAARVGIYSDILAASNFAGKSVAPVASSGRRSYGTYDMAGNVKEWCVNAVGSDRYILGGAWNEPATRSPLRRPITIRTPGHFGFRTISELRPAAVPGPAREPIERIHRDYSAEHPPTTPVQRVSQPLCL